MTGSRLSAVGLGGAFHYNPVRTVTAVAGVSRPVKAMMTP
jgi:hypothetical protein